MDLRTSVSHPALHPQQHLQRSLHARPIRQPPIPLAMEMSSIKLAPLTLVGMVRAEHRLFTRHTQVGNGVVQHQIGPVAIL